MKIKKLLLIFLTFFLSTPYSHALICQKSSSGTINDSMTINSTQATPSTLPKGTTIWRQPTQTLTVECWVDKNGRPGENVYLYSNPEGMNLGPDIEAGITYEGRNYYFTSNAGGGLALGWFVSGCAENDTCGWKKERKTMTYSLFFQKKSRPTENKEGALTNLFSYRAFQIDGKGGVRLGKSYNFTINGLNSFRYMPCASTVSISPSTINFGPIETSGAKAGATINETPFTITEKRSCNAIYGVSGYLEPLNATLSSDSNTLIPTDNDSVGITILDASDETVIPFKQDFVLAPKNIGFESNSREFLARLKWMKATPKHGEFNAGATLNIFYK
ncbi:fimbrial protein [Pseudomonas sp. OTU5201]|uniref:fimbrial protein n=1 Tax=Pseudomonas sp. OTU5201 TaxID=3043850 RepID=UPI00313EAD28